MNLKKMHSNAINNDIHNNKAMKELQTTMKYIVGRVFEGCP